MVIARYAIAFTVYFPLIKAGSNNFAVAADYTHVSGDTQISKDGGGASPASNAPTAITMGNGAMWSLALTATEMTANQVAVTVIDAATKAVEDQMILIQTYGTSGSGSLNLSDWADETLKRNYGNVTGEASYSLINNTRALRYWDTSGSTYTVRKEDGATAAWTGTLSFSSSGSGVSGVS